MPAKIEILSIPSLDVIGKRSFQMVSRLELGWHDQGNFLAVKITTQTSKRSKSKKNPKRDNEDQDDSQQKNVQRQRIFKDKSTSFEIFSVHRKNCPADRVDLGKDESGADILEYVLLYFMGS